MSTYLNGGANMFNVFSTYDFLLSLSLRPIVEVSFMPADLAANATATIFHYHAHTSPPASWDEWGALVHAFVAALVDRYGVEEVRQWRFEVWNEPNCGFWTGTQAEYWQLYNVTSRAIKSVDALLLVGGPATCQTAWIPEFLAYTAANNVPVDFVSTHLYPTDPMLPQTRDGFMQDIAAAAANASAAALPLVMTEFNAGLGIDVADGPYSAAFVVHNHFASQAVTNMDTLSFWTFSDIFEEEGFISAPYDQKFGMQTVYGVPKPVYRAFQFISAQVVAAPVRTSGGAAGVFATSGAVDVMVTLSAAGRTQYVSALLTNFDVMGQNVTNASVGVTFVNMSFASVPPTASLELIDSTHAYAKPVWIAAGSPQYPSQAEVDAEMVASQVVPVSVPLACSAAADTCTVTFGMEAISVARVSFAYTKTQ